MYSLIFVVGALLLVTRLLDVFLSDKQKTYLSDWSHSVWNWVDEAKKVSLFTNFTSPKTQRIISFLMYFISLIIFIIWGFGSWFLKPQSMWEDLEHITDPHFILGGTILIAIMVLSTKLLLPRIILYISRSKNLGTYVDRITLVNLLMAIMLLSLYLVYVNKTLEHIELNDFSYITIVLYLLFIWLPAMIVWVPLLIFSFFVYLVAILVCLTYILLYPLEFILRRIAEYPTGPVLAVSALATAIGGFLVLLR